MQVGSANIPPGIDVNMNPVDIGSWNGGIEFYKGVIDEPAMYPTPLSATQIAIHYANGINAGGTQAQLSISRSGSGGGNIASVPAGIDCGTICSHQFSAGTSVTITATPSAGSTFSGWTGGGCSGTAPCTIALNSNTSVDAGFALSGNPTLSVSKAGTGTGSVSSSPAGITCGTTCSAPYAPGTPVTLTATPDAGSTFAGWSGGTCSGTGTCSVTLNANTTVTATFTSTVNPTLSVSDTGTGTGTVTSSPAGINCGTTCSAPYATGTPVTLTATPDAGSAFTGWSGGGCSGTGTCSVTVNANTSVTATFTLSGGGGSTYPQVVTGDAPTSYWRLDETSGTTAADSVGASPGTYTGVALGAPGLLASTTDKAVTFNGSTSAVKVNSTTALSPPAKVSVEAWIKPAALPASGAFASVATKAESYSLQFNGPRMEFTIMQAGVRKRLQAPAGAIAVGGKYHVVGTYDGTTQRLYINGAQVASAALTGAITTNTNAFYIGTWNGSSERFNGVIDEVAVYPTVLSATQVSNHYNTGITSLVALVQKPASAQLVAMSQLGATRSAGIKGSTPFAVAIDNQLHRAYVTGNAANGHAGTGVTIFDSRTWRRLGYVNTSPTAGPSGVAVDPVTHLVYATSATYTPFDVHGSVKVIDGEAQQVIASIPTGPGPKAVAVNSATSRLYVTAQTGTDGDLAVWVFNLNTGKLITMIPVGPYGDYYDNPFGLSVNPKTNRVYASNPLDGHVYTIDGTTNAIVRKAAVGGEPGGIAVNTVTNKVFVTGARYVVEINGRSGSVEHRIAAGARTRGIAVDTATNKVYATTNGGGFLVIDGRTLNAGQMLTHGSKPNGIAIGSSGIVVANGLDANVSVFSDDAAGTS